MNNEQYRNEVKQRVKAHALRGSQEKTASVMGTGHSSVSKFLNGHIQPKLKTLQRWDSRLGFE